MVATRGTDGKVMAEGELVGTGRASELEEFEGSVRGSVGNEGV